MHWIGIHTVRVRVRYIYRLSPENLFASHPPAAVAVDAAVTAALLPTELAVFIATAEPLLTELTTATDKFCRANIPAVPGEAVAAAAEVVVVGADCYLTVNVLKTKKKNKKNKWSLIPSLRRSSSPPHWREQRILARYSKGRPRVQMKKPEAPDHTLQ